ncbi:hypothetical protein LQZ19_05265 [Treponema primitia]|uniref:hypothetical protein n=1 Tax=Treponema primitia TaxID=88058 RepID=UPI00397F28AF
MKKQIGTVPNYRDEHGKLHLVVEVVNPIFHDRELYTTLVSAYCEHCKKWHTHGIPPDGPKKGSQPRSAHCGDIDAENYYIDYDLNPIRMDQCGFSADGKKFLP